MAATEAQFTHGKLLEAASLLRLPVGALVDSLGLAPDVFHSAEGFSAMPSWAPITRNWRYPDADQQGTSSEGSLLGFDTSFPDHDMQEIYPTSRHLSVSRSRAGSSPSHAGLSPKFSSTSLSPGHNHLAPPHGISSPGSSAPLSRRTSPGYGPSPRPIKAEEGMQRDTHSPPQQAQPTPLGPCSKVWNLPPVCHCARPSL